MAIFAGVTSIWTMPKPAIFSLLNGLHEVLAHDVCGCLDAWTMAPLDNRFKLLLIPIFHGGGGCIISNIRK